MSRLRWMLLTGLVGVLVGGASLGALASLGPQAGRSRFSQEGGAAYGRLPLSFEQNRGQAPARFAYVAQGNGWGLRLGAGGAQLQLARAQRGAGSVLQMTTPGGVLRSPIAEQQQPGHFNYLVGSNRSAWVKDAPTFARVVYRDVWPGIDLAFAGHQGTLHYDVSLAPRADPGRVALRFPGARSIRSDGHGGAVIVLRGRTMRVSAPRAQQGNQRPKSWLVLSGDTLRLALGPYDHNRPLLVDPTLVYSAAIPAPPAAIAVDASGVRTSRAGSGARATSALGSLTS